jgi:hypothetical protein
VKRTGSVVSMQRLCVECSNTSPTLLVILVAILFGIVLWLRKASQGGTAYVGVVVYFLQMVLLLLDSQSSASAGESALLQTINIDVLAAAGNSCVMKMSDYSRVLSSIISPVAAFIAWFICFGASMLLPRTSLFSSSDSDRNNESGDKQQHNQFKTGTVHASSSSPQHIHMATDAVNALDLNQQHSVGELSMSASDSTDTIESDAAAHTLRERGGKCSCLSDSMCARLTPHPTSSIRGYLEAMHNLYNQKAANRSIVLGTKRDRIQALLSSQWLRTLLALYLLTFNGATQASFDVFNCIELSVDGHDQLVISQFPTVSCGQSQYVSLAAVAGSILALYVLIIPILLIRALYIKHVSRRSPTRRGLRGHVKRAQLKQPLNNSTMTRKQYVLGVMTSSYRDSAWVWRLFVLFRRLSLVVAIVFIRSHGWRLACATLLNVFYLLCHVSMWPYLRWIDNIMETVSLTSLVLLSVVLQQLSRPLESSERILVAIVWAMPFALLVVWAGIGWTLRRRCIADILEQKQGAAATSVHEVQLNGSTVNVESQHVASGPELRTDSESDAAAAVAGYELSSVSDSTSRNYGPGRRNLGLLLDQKRP